ncbi:MAG: hypothetical protein U0531_18245 [Dehalococcoidia bacterium]
MRSRVGVQAGWRGDPDRLQAAHDRVTLLVAGPSGNQSIQFVLVRLDTSVWVVANGRGLAARSGRPISRHKRRQASSSVTAIATQASSPAQG